MVPIGSLVVETLFSATGDRPQRVLQLDRQLAWQQRFAITMRSDGEVLVEHRQGTTISYARVHVARPAPDAVLRVTYVWHAPERHGILIVENLDSGALVQAAFDDPQPMLQEDIAALVSGAPDILVDPSVALIAVSDEIEPAGMTSGFVAGTMIATDTEPRPIETIRRGDLVETANHGLQPVRCVVSREVPALGSFAPICLRAPYFGLSRDISVAAEHRVLIVGADAEYLFGADSVLVEARHLARLAAEPRYKGSATVRYVQIVLDRHDCLLVSGAWGESLFLSDIADHPARLATSALTGITQQLLPRHSQSASLLLKNYEAMVLVSALCA